MSNITKIGGFDITAQSASYAATASVVLGSITSASYSDTAVSASYAVTASYALNSTPGTSGTNIGTVISITQIMYPFSGF